jgi:hypothetical protein
MKFQVCKNFERPFRFDLHIPAQSSPPKPAPRWPVLIGGQSLMATPDDSSPSTVSTIIFFLWSISALIAAVAALIWALHGFSSKASLWAIFTMVAILVADRYRR